MVIMAKHEELLSKFEYLIEKYRLSEDRYRTLFEESRDAIIITSPDGRFIDVNRAALEMFGYTRDEMFSNSVINIYADPEDRKRFIHEIEKKAFVRDFPVKLKKKDGRTMDCLFTFSIRRLEDDRIHEYQGIIRDVTEYRLMLEKLKELSLNDELTGLYNRRGLFTMAEHHLKIAKRLNRGLFCVFIDLDSMKQINDTYGHSTGDIALKDAADILRATFRDSDLISRIGGDEFVVLILVDDLESPEMILDRIEKNLKEFFIKNSRVFGLSFSVGISQYFPGSKISLLELISEADFSMYEHKKRKS